MIENNKIDKRFSALDHRLRTVGQWELA